MAEILFINGDYIKKYSHVNGSVEEANMVSFIVLAQDKWLQPLLGSALYNKLKELVEAGTVSGDYQTLLNNYVRRTLMWYTIYEMIPNLYVQLDNGSLVVRTSEDSTPIVKADLDRESSRALGNANFYAERMKYYLCQEVTIAEYTQEGDIYPKNVDYANNIGFL